MAIPLICTRNHRPSPARRAKLTAGFLATMLATGWPHSVLGQQLVLTADVDKAEFFESEPIYFLLKVSNVGSDTAWVTDFGFGSGALIVSVRRADGQAVPQGGVTVSFLAMPGWRGDPVPPRASMVSSELLQYRAGDERDFRKYLFQR